MNIRFDFPNLLNRSKYINLFYNGIKSRNFVTSQ